jgi:tetratricopeptide (TPR) repeat protein
MGAALLFAAHPAHVEAVAWISSRKDLVAAAFTLPAMAAYFAYRRGGPRARTWYAVSVVLFVLGVAGKLSVVVVPGILFLFDLLMEGRRLKDAVLDKIPYAAAAALIALRVMGAQPPTRKDFDLYVLGASMLQSLWLLAGFGEYVLSRLRPSPQDVAGAVAMLTRLVPFVLLVLPFVLRRRLPGIVTGLLTFLILSLLPAQVLNFINPVADRYLFFPSAAVVLLLGYLGLRSVRWGKAGLAGAGTLAVILLAGWTTGTLGYLGEWRDPRSVWFAASQKSEDPTVFENLGSHYQDAADALPANVRGRVETGPEDVARLAHVVWRDDQRLGPLLQEIQAPGINVPLSKALQDDLRARALSAYQEAVRRKGNRIMPNLLFRTGKLQLDAGQTDQAISTFQLAYDEAQRHTFPEVRQEYAVRSRYAMGVAHWQKGELTAALPLIREAEAAQQASGRTWIPNIERQEERLTSLIARADTAGAGTDSTAAGR